jgi:hypothetical protein
MTRRHSGTNQRNKGRLRSIDDLIWNIATMLPTFEDQRWTDNPDAVRREVHVCKRCLERYLEGKQ